MGDDLHALGQLRSDLGDAGLHPLAHFAAVLTREHQRRSNDGLVTVQCRGAGAELRTERDLGHVLHLQRGHGGAELYRQVADFVPGRHPAHRPDGELLAVAADDAAARVLDVLLDDLRQLAEGHADTLQRLGLRLDHVLLLVAAARVDLGDARHRAEQRLDGVFLDLGQLHELLQLARRLVGRIRLVLNVVVEDLAQTRADRRELRRGTGRQLFDRILESLGNELPGAIDVGAVHELQRDLRQTELRQRSHFLDAW